MDNDIIAAATRDYRPLLDDLVKLFEAELGRVLWYPRPDSFLDKHGSPWEDGPECVRVGPIKGELFETGHDYERLHENLDQVLRRHRFYDADPFELADSGSGHMITEARNGAGAILTVWIRTDVEAFVDVPLKG